MVSHYRMHVSKKCALHCFLGCFGYDTRFRISCGDSREERLLWSRSFFRFHRNVSVYYRFRKASISGRHLGHLKMLDLQLWNGSELLKQEWGKQILNPFHIVLCAGSCSQNASAENKFLIELSPHAVYGNFIELQVEKRMRVHFALEKHFIEERLAVFRIFLILHYH